MAAVVVLVFHVLLLSPTFAEGRPPGVRPAEPTWWLTHTPLYLVWAGREAVFVFFVLSGFVLALPATRRRVRWRAYYPQRLLRLYVPVWGSLLVAAALATLVPRNAEPGLSHWYGAHVGTPDAGEALRDGVLLLGTSWLNSPLWSLQFEVLFSLLLPAYLVLARWRRGAWPVKSLVLLAAVVVARLFWRPEVFYLAMFACGVLMAFEQDRLSSTAARITRRGFGGIIAAGCGLLLTVEASLLVTGLDRSLLRGLGVPLQMIGACLAVALALHWEPARRRLCLPWAQWIGSRSFSLYLVHEPLAVTSGALWPWLPLAGHLAIVLPVSLLVAHGFHRVVEAPAHRLSRAAARRLR